ncbi:hypothetical protein OKW24_001259 [Peribacillus simplex]|nr:hypothetical protein [Peribacillus simplex]
MTEKKTLMKSLIDNGFLTSIFVTLIGILTLVYVLI